MTDSLVTIVELFAAPTAISLVAAAAARRVRDNARSWVRRSWLGTPRAADSRVSAEWLREHELTSAKHSGY